MTVDYPQFGTLEATGTQESRVRTTAQNLRKLAEQQANIPFDPFAFAEKIGIAVQFAQLPPGCSGRLRTDTGCAFIELSNTEPSNRRRFTLCHELAHICFWSGDPVMRYRGISIDGETGMQKQESLCNQIASELLMPHDVFVARAKEAHPSFDAVKSLAREFDVSILAALEKLSSTSTHRWHIARVKWNILANNILQKIGFDIRGARLSSKTLPFARSTVIDTIKRAESLLINNPFVLSGLAGGYLTLAMNEPVVTIWRERADSGGKGKKGLCGAICFPSKSAH
jgi:Zn-dependent peptidase ImmA (M78 family)